MSAGHATSPIETYKRELLDNFTRLLLETANEFPKQIHQQPILHLNTHQHTFPSATGGDKGATAAENVNLGDKIAGAVMPTAVRTLTHLNSSHHHPSPPGVTGGEGGFNRSAAAQLTTYDYTSEDYDWFPYFFVTSLFVLLITLAATLFYCLRLYLRSYGRHPPAHHHHHTTTSFSPSAVSPERLFQFHDVMNGGGVSDKPPSYLEVMLQDPPPAYFDHHHPLVPNKHSAATTTTTTTTSTTQRFPETSALEEVADAT